MKERKKSSKKLNEENIDGLATPMFSEMSAIEAMSKRMTEPMLGSMSAVEAIVKRATGPMLGSMSAIEAMSKRMTEPMLGSMSAIEAMSKRMTGPMFGEMNAVQAALKGVAFPKQIISDSLFEVLSKIGQNQARIFEPWKDWTSQFKKSTDYIHLNELQGALSSITSQMAILSAATNRRDILEDIEEASEGLANINSTVLDKDYVTKQDLEELKIWLSKSLEKRKDKKSIADIILYVIGVIWMFVEISNLVLEKIQSPDLQAATRKDIDNFKREVLDSLKAFESKSEIKRSWRDCKVYHRCNRRSLVLGTIPKGTEVTILSRRHKWVYISFKNQEDNLLQTGWIMKKYLSTQK